MRRPARIAPAGFAYTPYFPEAGYSQTSGVFCVLLESHFSGASAVVMIWCG